MVFGTETTRLGWATLLLFLILTPGCQRSESEREVPTIDVPPPLAVETSNDPQADEEQVLLIGILPDDFPDDLPIYLPASLIDFGRTEGGLRFVHLISPHRLSRVRRELGDLMSAGGWSSEAGGQKGRARWRKGIREVWLRVEDARPGALCIFEY